MIVEFQGEYRWLSNFWAVEIKWEGIPYKSVEHAYQGAKCVHRYDKIWINVFTAAEAKRFAKTVEIRPDWDTCKLAVMYDLLRLKFEDPELERLLLQTHPQNIQEGNRWGDEFWGINLNKNPNVGENHLGRLLMLIRDEKLNQGR